MGSSRKRRPIGRLLLLLVALVFTGAIVAGIMSAIWGGGATATPAGTPAPSASASGGTAPGAAASPATEKVADKAAEKPADKPAEPTAKDGATAAATDTATPATPAAAPTAGKPALRARVFTPAEAGTPWKSLGSADDGAGANAPWMRLDFSPSGAGVERLELANHRESIKPGAAPVVLQQTWSFDGLTTAIVPLAMLSVTIDGQQVNLFTRGSDAGYQWRQVRATATSVEFEAIVEDASATPPTPVAKLVRVYELPPGGYQVVVRQRWENLAGRPVTMHWQQYGPGDLERFKYTYGGDLRRVRFGYIEPPEVNPDGQLVSATRFIRPHQSLLKTPRAGATAWEFEPVRVWETDDTREAKVKLSWMAVTDRYFAVAMHAWPDSQDKQASGALDKSFERVYEVFAWGLVEPVPDASTALQQSVLGLYVQSKQYTVPAGAGLDATFGVYAGPVSGREIRAGLTGTTGGVAASLGIDGLEVYKMTVVGPCAFCTFQPVARVLRATLGVLHAVTFDWAIAVILLVVVVRGVLHPVTRWSQKNLTRFGKQMASLGPKQAKLKERYKDDPKKFREEVAKLMKEENVNYAGALGCVPIFLQMPIWIALYAMVFFTFELRHEGGFYGVFQAVSGGNWGFLGDLAEPDRFIALSGGFYIPGLRTLMGDIDGINVIPLLLGVVFWFQQKYMTPPTTATMTPEQETQQKIVKVMMVVMLPLFMYNAPAALSLYFMTNSILGIFESKWIRSMVEREDAEAEARKREGGATGRPGATAAAPKKLGWVQRLQAAVEARQKELEARRREQQRKGK